MNELRHPAARGQKAPQRFDRQLRPVLQRAEQGLAEGVVVAHGRPTSSAATPPRRRAWRGSAASRKATCANAGSSMARFPRRRSMVCCAATGRHESRAPRTVAAAAVTGNGLAPTRFLPPRLASYIARSVAGSKATNASPPQRAATRRPARGPGADARNGAPSLAAARSRARSRAAPSLDPSVELDDRQEHGEHYQHDDRAHRDD